MGASVGTERLGSGEKMADSAVRDTVEYLAKSSAAFTLSLTSLILTGLGWVLHGLHIALEWLSDQSFFGASKLHIAVMRIRWYKKDKDETKDKVRGEKHEA